MSAKILFSRTRIQRRVTELAREIDRHYRGKDLVLIGVLNGSVIFLADLVRRLKTPHSFDCVSVSSYGAKTTPSAHLIFHPNLKISVRGAHVLLVDDILDTGRTLQRLSQFFRTLRPASLDVCVLLRKRVQRPPRLRTRFVGFEVPNHFVYGYGLDIGEKFRNLPHIVYRVK